MSEFNLLKCPQFLDNAITPPAKEIGTTLGNIFYAIFSPINYNVEKLKIRQSENLKKYQSDIESEVSVIPEDNLTEPKLSIVGPALEASKYYIEDSELRKMFAKLIAASMDTSKLSNVHPSFVEIIKQLSPLDAKVLSLFDVVSVRPIADYKLNYIESFGGGIELILRNVFLCSDIDSDLISLSSSITNLNRLQMVRISFDKHFTNESVYIPFKETEIFTTLKNIITTKTFTENITFWNKYVKHSSIHNVCDIDINQGYVSITTLGEQFIKTCL